MSCISNNSLFTSFTKPLMIRIWLINADEIQALKELYKIISINQLYQHYRRINAVSLSEASAVISVNQPAGRQAGGKPGVAFGS